MERKDVRREGETGWRDGEREKKREGEGWRGGERRGERDAKERRWREEVGVVIPSSPLASLLAQYNPAQVAHSPADPKEKGVQRGFKGGQDASSPLILLCRL